MAQHRPNRKKKINYNKTEKHDPLDRAVKRRVARRRVERKKKKKGVKEWKEMLYVIVGMILVMALIIILYQVIRVHQELKHH
jgi:hypothetical protein